ncbi:secreted protein containing Peptidase S1 and S6, chymotrypsin/Hap domain protein [Candidatus Magnetomorum sp. HK-1]|nr:secreted protein containing Peptidase S1 and S6, chymotrypsin/Hap domain protein [Candidatus Magnetomorum sp. HK-1]
MRYFIILLCFIFFICACNKGASTDSQTSSSINKKSKRIVGGEPTSNRWQFMAALIDSSTESVEPFCGATLVSNSWIITAAHCLENQTTDSILVFIGSNDLNSEEALRIPIKQMIIHPGYHSDTVDSDLALLELSESVTNYPPLSILPENIETKGLDAIIMGWGQTGEYLAGSDILLQATVPVASNEACRSVFGNVITENMICAGELSSKKDSCYGDSGGPLVVYTNGNYYLAGIVSWGEGCARNGSYGVYTRVSEFHSFIYDCISHTSWASEIVAEVKGEVRKTVRIGSNYNGFKQSPPSHTSNQMMDTELIDTDNAPYIQIIHSAHAANMYTWMTEIEYKPLSNPLIDISWASETFNPKGHYILIEGKSIYGNVLIDDMRKITHYSYIDLKPKHYFTICWILETKKEIILQQGWNLISFPHIPIENTIYFQDKLAYIFDKGTYIQPKTILPGKGYWIFSLTKEHFLLNGIPVESCSMELTAGWHLLGSIDQSSIIQTYPENCIEQIVKWHEGSYSRVSEIEPGQGYWIKLKQDCSLIWKKTDTATY